MNPGSVRGGKHSLGAKDKAIGICILKGLKHALHLLGRVLLRCLHAPALKDLVCIMIMVMAAVVLVLLMLVIMAAVMLVLLVLVVVAAVMLVLFMLMIVAAVVLMLLVLVLLVLMILIMIVMMSAVHGVSILVSKFLCMLIMMVMMVVMLLFCRHNLSQDFTLKILAAFDCLEDLPAVKLCQRRCDDGCLLVVLTDQCDRFVNFLLGYLIRSGKEYGSRILNLIDKELSEILEIHSGLCGIHDGNRTSDLHVRNLLCGLFNGAHHIVELSDTGGLDQNPLRLIRLHHLLQRGIEVAYK